MITVYKYELKPQSSGLAGPIEMPAGAQVLRVGAQGTQAFLWARVDTDADLVRRDFALVGTGHVTPTAEQAAYVGTFDMSFPGEPTLVFHVFERVSSSRKEGGT